MLHIQREKPSAAVEAPLPRLPYTCFSECTRAVAVSSRTNLDLLFKAVLKASYAIGKSIWGVFMTH